MYEATDIAERIKFLAKQKKIQIKAMLEDCGLSKNMLSSMLSGGSIPKSENLAKIADYLGCSVDYLLGRTEYQSPTGGQNFPQNEKSSSTLSGNGAEEFTLEDDIQLLERLLVNWGVITPGQDLSDEDTAYISALLDLLRIYLKKSHS